MEIAEYVSVRHFDILLRYTLRNVAVTSAVAMATTAFLVFVSILNSKILSKSTKIKNLSS